MRSTLRMTAFATVSAFALMACNAEQRMDTAPVTPNNNAPTNAPGTGPDGEPLTPEPEPPPPPPKASYSGVYETGAPIDFTQNGVLPGVWGPVLSAASKLNKQPGVAILELLEGTNIPYLSAILMKIPDFIMTGLGGMLDKLIVDYAYKGYPVLDQITSIVMGIAEVTKYVEITDKVTVHTPGADMNVMVDHELTHVTFKLLGNKTKVALASAMVPKASTPGKITPAPNDPVADAELTFGAATYSLPIGSLMLQGMGPLLFNKFGGATTLDGALKNLMDGACQGFGDDLSDGTAGFIDAADGKALCLGGVGLLAGMVTGEIDKVRLDNVKVDGVTGKLYDESMAVPAMDHQSDRLAEGKWNWTFTVGGGTAVVPSSFAGERTGTAN